MKIVIVGASGTMGTYLSNAFEKEHEIVRADARIDTDGKLRVQLGREDIPVSSRLRFNFMANSDKEYMAGFRYILTKYISLSTHYDSDMGLGGGLTITC